MALLVVVESIQVALKSRCSIRSAVLGLLVALSICACRVFGGHLLGYDWPSWQSQDIFSYSSQRRLVEGPSRRVSQNPAGLNSSRIDLHAPLAALFSMRSKDLLDDTDDAIFPSSAILDPLAQRDLIDQSNSTAQPAAAPVPGFPDLGDLAPQRILLYTPWWQADADRRKRKMQFQQSQCAGFLTSLQFSAAGIGLQIASAAQDCDFDNIHTFTDKTGLVGQITFQSPARCSRDIFGVMRDTSAVAQLAMKSAKVCSGINEPCGLAIADLFRKVGNVGEAGSRMGAQCGNTAIKRYACADDLERLAWQLGPLLGDISASSRVCKKYPNTKKPDRDYASCVGDVMASAGYIAAGALEFSSGVHFCGVKTHDDGALIDADMCVDRIFSGLRAVSVSSVMATRAAGHCGGFNTRCPRDLELMSAALFSIGEAAGQAANVCEEGSATLFSRRMCLRDSGSLSKSVAVVVAKAVDAASSCTPKTLPKDTCAANIAKVIAAVSYIVEHIGRATLSCDKGPTGLAVLRNFSLYGCSRDIERIGGAADTMSRALGAAVADCGLGGAAIVAKHIPLSRRFYTA